MITNKLSNNYPYSLIYKQPQEKFILEIKHKNKTLKYEFERDEERDMVLENIKYILNNT